MKTTLFRFGRTAACLTLAVALLTGCSCCRRHPPERPDSRRTAQRRFRRSRRRQAADPI